MKDYLENCRVITFEKITNHAKKRNDLMFQVIFIFSDQIFINSCPYLMLGETYFRKNAAWENE